MVRLCRWSAYVEKENALTAAGTSRHRYQQQMRTRLSVNALEKPQGARRWRLETLVGERTGAPASIDYAHKPDAVAKTLEAPVSWRV